MSGSSPHRNRHRYGARWGKSGFFRAPPPPSIARARYHLSRPHYPRACSRHATRSALASVVLDLTGREPVIFEAARITDTGAYNGPALAYNTAGAWGSLNLPFQVFVTVKRQPTEGISTIAGYGTAGPLARANLTLSTGQVTDADIYAAVASIMPTAGVAWTAITN